MHTDCAVWPSDAGGGLARRGRRRRRPGCHSPPRRSASTGSWTGRSPRLSRSEGAYPQPGQLLATHDIRERHGGLDCHPSGEWGVRRRGVQVVVPLVVPDELGQRVGLAQQAVDDLDDGRLVDLHSRRSRGAELAYGAQLRFVPLAITCPPQVRTNSSSAAMSGRCSSSPSSVLTSAAAAASATSVS